MKNWKIKLSQLSPLKRDRLAYLLDRHTYVGFCTAGRVARGEYFDHDPTLFEIFKHVDGVSDHRAKLLSNMAMKYDGKKALEEIKEMHDAANAKFIACQWLYESLKDKVEEDEKWDVNYAAETCP
jgi:peroxiredoxin family protein